MLELGLRWKWTVIGASLLLFVGSLVAYRFLGTEFVPTLEEGSIQVRITNIPSTSLVEALSVAKRAERVLNGLPEVVYTVSKVGLAERGDVEDVSNIETYVALKPFASWPKGATKETLATTIRDKLETAVPSALFSVSQPIQMRVDELVSGIRAMLAIKIYGDDLKTLSRLGEEVKQVLSTVKGVTDLQVETVLGKPTLTIQVDRAQVARYGLNVDDVLQVVRAGIGGGAGEHLNRWRQAVRDPGPVRRGGPAGPGADRQHSPTDARRAPHSAEAGRANFAFSGRGANPAGKPLPPPGRPV